MMDSNSLKPCIANSDEKYLWIWHFSLQETYPSTPPVWFAESEETSVTNAVQILSNTFGRDNHVINQVIYLHNASILELSSNFNWNYQVEILLRELCRLHTVSLPADLENLALPMQLPADLLVYNHSINKIEDIESDPDDLEDAVIESEQESEGDEDLPLEMDEGRNVNKVSRSRIV